jgi:hypothetical protein
MTPRERRAYSALHYAVGILFLLTPALSGAGWGGPQVMIPLCLGALMTGITFSARDRIGPARIIDGSTRHDAELTCSALLCLSPWLFGFSDLTWRPYLIVGQVGIGVSILTRWAEEFSPRDHFAAPSRNGSGPQSAAQGPPTSQNRAASVLSPSRSSGP